MKRYLALLLLVASVTYAQVINCPSGFTTTPGSQCYIASYLGNGSTPANNFGRVSYIPQLVGSAENLQAASAGGHTSAAMNFMEQVPVSAFTTTFQFVPNGWNIALAFSNSYNNADFNGIGFVAGAGVEGGFFQGFPSPSVGPPASVFAIQFDQNGSLTAGGSNWTYSSVQEYTAGQSPANPNQSEPIYIPKNKISTSPVPLNVPAVFTGSISGTTMTVTAVTSGKIMNGATVQGPGYSVGDGTTITACSPSCGGVGTYTVSVSQAVPSETLNTGINTTTQDTYSATISYDGSNLNLCLYDVTLANGSCSSATSGTGTYFQYTWTGINIPAAVGGTDAWVGLYSSTNSNVPWNLLVNNFTYTVNTPANSFPFAGYSDNSTTNNGATSTASPVLSVAPGSYSGTQTVTITDSTSGSNICYLFVPNGTSLTVLPQVGNDGTCRTGTAYSSPISVSTSGTLYAIAGTGYTVPASSTVAGVYTIGALPQVATPTFSPAGGTYTTAQTVTIHDTTAGATIYYTLDGTTPTTSSPVYSSPVSVASSLTVKAIATASGYSQSAVASAPYTITSVPTLAAPTFSPAAPASLVSPQTITISGPAGATLCYTLGATPPPNPTTPGTCAAGSTTYTTGIVITGTTTLNALATQAGYSNSSVTSGVYTLTVATPVFTPPGGSYSTGQIVSISDTTPGSSIYYTIDGTTPTPTSTPYTIPIVVGSTTTLKAIGVLSGASNSAIASATYTLPAQSSITVVFHGSQVTFNGSGSLP